MDRTTGPQSPADMVGGVLLGGAPAPPAPTPFYVVSPAKFALLFVTTLGAYQAFWFFANWRRYRNYSGRRLSPFWRAMFAILFAHRLFALLREHAERLQPTLRVPAEFLAAVYATLWVVERIASHFAPKDDTWSAADTVGLLCTLGTGVPLFLAQRAANVASEDREGCSNHRLTAVNYFFVALGTLVWLLLITSLAGFWPEVDPELGG